MATEPKAPVTRAPIREKFRRKLSDEEIMREFSAEEADPFFIDPDVIPENLAYEWKRLEVYGKEDKPYETELARRGWVPVMAESHDGYFMPKGFKGPVIRGGLGLYAMDKTEHENRNRYQQLIARQAVVEHEKTLGIAPAGTGSRDHPQSKPRVVKNYEQVDVE